MPIDPVTIGIILTLITRGVDVAGHLIPLLMSLARESGMTEQEIVDMLAGVDADTAAARERYDQALAEARARLAAEGS